MILNRGYRGLSPCGVCLVPSDKLSDLRQVFPKRTSNATKQAIQLAKTLS